MAVKEVLIAYDENWQRQHLATLRTCYGSAPYFEYYFPAYEKMFQKKFNYLYDFNYAALTLVLAQLKLSIPIHESDAYVEDKPIIISTPKPYHQVFEEKFGFVENLSIIDLILNKGPEARSWL